MLLSVSSLLGTGSAVLAAEAEQTQVEMLEEDTEQTQVETLEEETEQTQAETPEEETEQTQIEALEEENTEEAETAEETETAVSTAEEKTTGSSETDTETEAVSDGEAIAACSVSYELGGGSNSESNPASYVLGSGTVALQDPTRDYYTFKGWYLDEGFTKDKLVTELSDTIADPEKGIVLYAKWEKTVYTITYKPAAKNVVLPGSNPSTYKLGEFPTLKEPTRKGYTFKGWYLDKDYTTKLSAAALSKNPKNVRLYARWRYPITYKLNGGTNNSSNPTGYYRSSEITLKNPTKKGYIFKGWYSDKACTVRVKKIAKGSYGRQTLYAKWKKRTYTITYYLRNGTNAKGNPSKYTITSKKITLQKPTRYAYTFLGWYKDKACTKKVTAIKKGSVGNRVLYAKGKKGFDPQILIDTAKKEIGYYEKKNANNLYSFTANRGSGLDNYTKYAWELHQIRPTVCDFPVQWCDTFVNWCFMAAYGVKDGARILGGNYYDYCGDNVNQYRYWGRWSHTPHVGDHMFFYNGSFYNHATIVYKVTDTYVYFIEGNHNDRVQTRRCRRDNPKIGGYGSPLYYLSGSQS